MSQTHPVAAPDTVVQGDAIRLADSQPTWHKLDLYQVTTCRPGILSIRSRLFQGKAGRDPGRRCRMFPCPRAPESRAGRLDSLGRYDNVLQPTGGYQGRVFSGFVARSDPVDDLAEQLDHANLTR